MINQPGGGGSEKETKEKSKSSANIKPGFKTLPTLRKNEGVCCNYQGGKKDYFCAFLY